MCSKVTIAKVHVLTPLYKLEINLLDGSGHPTIQPVLWPTNGDLRSYLSQSGVYPARDLVSGRSSG